MIVKKDLCSILSTTLSFSVRSARTIPVEAPARAPTIGAVTPPLITVAAPAPIAAPVPLYVASLRVSHPVIPMVKNNHAMQ